jgi:iron-sulfur cluster assembly protein
VWSAETQVGRGNEPSLHGNNPRPSACAEVTEVKVKGRREPTIGPEGICAALSQVKDPDLGRDIVTLGFVRDISGSCCVGCDPADS